MSEVSKCLSIWKSHLHEMKMREAGHPDYQLRYAGFDPTKKEGEN